VLLVKGFKLNAITRYSDYKRFNVETLNSIGKPKEAPPATTPSTTPSPVPAPNSAPTPANPQ
jgi:hypothetical protein